MRTIIKRLVVITAVLATVSLSARADIYTFDSITSYTNEGYQSVSSQLTMEVVSSDTTSAVLSFSNLGPVTSAVTQIFFEYSEYTGSEYSVAAPTDWTLKGVPPPLAGGNTVGFSGDFSLNADAPSTMTGIEEGESLLVTLSYNPYFSIIDALDGGLLRVGLHTLGVLDTAGRVITQEDIDANEKLGQEMLGNTWTYSESHINNIPEAASSSLILLCSVGSLFLRRFFRA